MPELSRRAKDYRGSPIRKISSMLEKIGKDPQLVSFGGGAPSLAPPKEVIDFVINKLKKEPQKTTSYCSTNGMPTERQLISENLKDEEKIDIDPDSIMLTNGGTEGIFVVIQSILNPGNEIITTDPCYLGYNEMIRMTGAHKVSVPIHWSEDFQVNTDLLQAQINSRTRAVLITSPDNPTGAVQNKKSMEAIVDICQENDLWLITDDIYKDIVFDGKFVNSRIYGGYENTITCCSFSKSASIPGVRIGYNYGPKEAISKICELKQSTSLTAPRLASYFIEGFLQNKSKVKKDYVKKIVVPTYKERRDYMAKMLKKYTDLEFSIPQGAFYFFPEINTEDEMFCDRLFKDRKVFTVPGKYFGDNGRRHMRLTFVSEDKPKIEEGVKRIADELNNKL